MSIGYKLGRWIGGKSKESYKRQKREVKLNQRADKTVECMKTMSIMRDTFKNAEYDDVIDIKTQIDQRIGYQTSNPKKRDKEKAEEKAYSRVMNQRLHYDDYEYLQDYIKNYKSKDLEQTK